MFGVKDSRFKSKKSKKHFVKGLRKMLGGKKGSSSSSSSSHDKKDKDKHKSKKRKDSPSSSSDDSSDSSDKKKKKKKKAKAKKEKKDAKKDDDDNDLAAIRKDMAASSSQAREMMMGVSNMVDSLGELLRKRRMSVKQTDPLSPDSKDAASPGGGSTGTVLPVTDSWDRRKPVKLPDGTVAPLQLATVATPMNDLDARTAMQNALGFVGNAEVPVDEKAFVEKVAKAQGMPAVLALGDALGATSLSKRWEKANFILQGLKTGKFVPK